MKRILVLCACLLVLCASPLPALAAEAGPAPYTSIVRSASACDAKPLRKYADVKN